MPSATMGIRPTSALTALQHLPFVLIAGLPAFSALLVLPPGERFFVGLIQTLFALVPATLFLAFGGLAIRPSHRHSIASPRVRALIVLVVAWALFSALRVARVPDWAFFWSQFVFWGVLSACVMRAAVERHGADLVLVFLRSLLWAGPLYGAVVALYYHLYGDAIPEEWSSLLPAFGNVRRAGHLLTLSATAGAMLVALRLGGRVTVVLTLIAAAVAFWAGARGTLLVLVTAIPFTLLVSGHAKPSTLLRVAVVLLAAAALSALAPTPNVNFGLINMVTFAGDGAPTADALSSSRISMWRDAMANIALRPLTGWGYAHAALAPHQAPVFHLHNWPLELLLAWGVPMGALAGALVFSFWLKAQRRMGPEQAAALGVLNVAAAYSLISGTYFYGVPVILMSIAWGVALARPSDESGERRAYIS